MKWIRSDKRPDKAGGHHPQPKVGLKSGKKIELPVFDLPVLERSDVSTGILKTIAEKVGMAEDTILDWLVFGLRNRLTGHYAAPIRAKYDPPTSVKGMTERCQSKILGLTFSSDLSEQEKGRRMYATLQKAYNEDKALAALYAELFPIDDD